MATLGQVIGVLWKISDPDDPLGEKDALPVYLEITDVPPNVTEFVCLEQIIHEIDEGLLNTALDV